MGDGRAGSGCPCRRRLAPGPSSDPSSDPSSRCRRGCPPGRRSPPAPGRPARAAPPAHSARKRRADVRVGGAQGHQHRGAGGVEPVPGEAGRRQGGRTMDGPTQRIWSPVRAPGPTSSGVLKASTRCGENRGSAVPAGSPIRPRRPRRRAPSHSATLGMPASTSVNSAEVVAEVAHGKPSRSATSPPGERLLVGDDHVRRELPDRRPYPGGHRLGERRQEPFPEELQRLGAPQFRWPRAVTGPWYGPGAREDRGPLTREPPHESGVGAGPGHSVAARRPVRPRPRPPG